MYRLIIISLFVLPTFLISACDSSEPDDSGPGEQELITRVVLTLTGGGQTITAEANDPDGDGTGFELDTITLVAGTSYIGTIELFNDIADENITDEVREESDHHQFFYTPGGGVVSRLTVTITDEDDNGLPVGLDFTMVDTGDGAATGTLNVVLSHYDNDPKNGTDRSQDTDVDVTFPVSIE